MNKKQWLGLGLVTVAAIGLAACGNRASKKDSANSESKTDLKAAIITDTGGVDDKSFNQSAWEGLQAWGKENGLSKGNGFDYFQSTDESQYATNLDEAVSNDYKLIFGVGFALSDSVKKAAKDNQDVNYVIIDDRIEGQKNVASAVYADNEAGYLAGIAAAKTTKTKQVGFVGGMESEVITRFRAGFEAGSFGDSAKGKTIAAAQYAAGADVIYQVAGGTGAGVFSEAKDLNEKKNEDEKVWVLGVDRDQKAEGEYTSKDGKKSNFVLASSLKKVGESVKDLAKKTADGKFPGGKVITYSLKDGGVDLTTDNLSADAKKAVEDAKAKILDGSLKVPEK